MGGAGPPGGEDARHAVEGVDAQPGVVRHGDHTSGLGDRPGLEQSVLVERRPGLRHLGDAGEGVDGHELDRDVRLREDPAHLLDLVRVPGRQDDHAERACAWSLASSRQPAEPRSSSESSRARSKGSRSAVPWTSTKRPSPVQTTFMSVSARTSSSYCRSSRGTPLTMPTDTAATVPDSGSAEAATWRSPLAQVIASASATYAPVMAAVRVPPSACSTSQSRTIVF